VAFLQTLRAALAGQGCRNRPTADASHTSPRAGDAGLPTGMLGTVLIVVVLAALIVVPGFVLLFVLDQKGLLPEGGVDDESVVDRPTIQ
jgi:hypothetical protein